MHGKGKTTLLEYLRQSDKLNSASIELPPSLHSKSTKSNAVGITVNVWSYCKHMHNPTSEFPMIDFYTWDFVGEVSVIFLIFICICMLLLHRMNIILPTSCFFTLVHFSLLCGTY